MGRRLRGRRFVAARVHGGAEKENRKRARFTAVYPDAYRCGIPYDEGGVKVHNQKYMVFVSDDAVDSKNASLYIDSEKADR